MGGRVRLGYCIFIHSIMLLLGTAARDQNDAVLGIRHDQPHHLVARSSAEEAGFAIDSPRRGSLMLEASEKSLPVLHVHAWGLNSTRVSYSVSSTRAPP